MKIVSWNLRNIGSTKLQNTFAQKFIGFGLGNNVADYITGLVMGDARWNAVPNLSTNPADVFVIIELKSGGKKKGRLANGTCLPTMTSLVNMLNTIAAFRHINAQFLYQGVIPLIIGYHETVGIIYNTRKLQLNNSAVSRNQHTGNWITPRTVFGANFTVVADNSPLNIVGLHAPPPGGGGPAQRYRPPIEYASLLPTAPIAASANTFFMGDFNTDPGYTYINGNNQPVQALTGMTAMGYHTFLANNTLSSVRTNVNNAFNPPANYLSDAFDNIIFNKALQQNATRQTVPDMIGQARDMNGMNTPNIAGTNLRLLVNAYNTVSDHLPVVIEY